MKKIHDLFAMVAGSGSQENQAVRAVLETWQKQPVADPSLSHYLSRYVVLGVSSDDKNDHDEPSVLAALAVESLGIGADACAVFNLKPKNESDSLAYLEALFAFLRKDILVAYRTDFLDAVLVKSVVEHSGVELSFPAWLDLALLLPEVFSEGPGRNAMMADWLVYLGLPEERHGALGEALATARLFQMVLAKAGEKGLSLPSDLQKLEKARRWLWSH